MISTHHKFDCIIVGGGLIGLLSAYMIAKQGRKVVLLEQSTLGQESSWAGGGILSPLYPWRYPDAVSELVNWSRKNWSDFIQQIQQESGSETESLASGMLILHEKEQAQAQEWAARFDVTLKKISANELHELEPELRRQTEDALWMPEVGQVRNPRLLKAVHLAAIKAGVTIFENHAVSELLSQQGRINGVACQQQTFFADNVVVTAGAWSAELLSSLGYEIPVQPVRGQMIQIQARPGLIKHITLSEGRYIIPRRDGKVLVGSTLEYAGFDKSLNDKTRDELQATAIAIAPALADYEVVNHWAGLRPGSPQGIPTIGEVPHIKGLFINSGHFRNGVALSLSSCQLLCDLVLEQKSIINPSAYAPQ